MAAGLYDITNETLGKGHFAVVKLAKHCLTGELVAIKIIDKSRLNNENIQQLGQEIRLLSRLSEKEHPNIVKLYQVIDTKSKLYLVMEYPGRDVCDLYDFIQKHNFRNGVSEEKAKHIFKQICSAIAYCHSMRIVHRDLKPENILIVNQPEDVPQSKLIDYPIVKLIDFGFSNQWKEGEKLKTSCGSLAYSAPEILLGVEYEGDKVDIWGLGCIFYILLYGSNPFMQVTDSETLIRILDCSFTTPYRPNISEDSIKLIKSLLKKEPQSRLTIQQILDFPWLNDNQNQSFNKQILQETDESKNDIGNTSIDEEMIELKKKLNAVSNSCETELNLTKKYSFSKEIVHDKIIEYMISKGMCNSKEQIENAIKSCRNIANTTKTDKVKIFDKLNEEKEDLGENDFEEKYLNKENQENNYQVNKFLNGFNLDANTCSKDVARQAYLKATYHLIKDKLYREHQGINLTNQVQSKILHNKKILPNRPRKSIIKPPQFGIPVVRQNLDLNNSVKKKSFEEQDENLREIINNCTSKNYITQNLKPSLELPIYEEDNNGLMLPLARKCSIVSEEGSCLGTSDYSGNECSTDYIHDAGLNSLGSHTDYQINNEFIKKDCQFVNNRTAGNSANSSKRNSFENIKVQSMPLVNIVITDLSSTIEELSKQEENEDVDYFENKIQEKEDTENNKTSLEQNSIENTNNEKNVQLKLFPSSNPLHLVSSSPDLIRKDSFNQSCEKIILNKEEQKNERNLIGNHILDRTSSSKFSIHTSMRIILQSKSYNNILYDNENHNLNCNNSIKNFSSKTKQLNDLNRFSRFTRKKNQIKQNDLKKSLSQNLSGEAKKCNDSKKFFVRKFKTDKIDCCAIL